MFGCFSWLFRGFFLLGKFYAYSPWKSLLMNGGLAPQIFREHPAKNLPGKSGLLGADQDRSLRISQPWGKSRNCPERGLFGLIDAFWAKPPFAKPKPLFKISPDPCRTRVAKFDEHNS